MNRHAYLDQLRIISAFAVIAIHVLTHYLGGFPLRGGRWMVTMLLKHSLHFCIPMFFMISGALLIKPLSTATYTQYLHRRLARIGIPFVVWSFIHWLVVSVLAKHGHFSPLLYIKGLLSNGITGQYWYVYATLALYLFLPFIGELVSILTRTRLKVLIGIMVFINLVLPFLNEMLLAFTKWKLIVYSMSSLGAYLTYALLGYALHTMVAPPAKHWRILIYSAAIASYLLINLSCWVLSKHEYVNSLGETQYPLALMMAIALFVFARTQCDGLKEAPKGIAVLSTNSYTAYLTHMLCLRLIQGVWKTKYVCALPAPKAALIMMSEYVLALIGSFSIAMVVHKLPRASRYL